MKIRLTSKYTSYVDNFTKDLLKKQDRDVRKAALLIKRTIRKKARKMKKTGNLVEGVYHKKQGAAYFVGLRRPAYHAYLIEFGHKARDGSNVEAYPIVYPSYQEKADAVGEILASIIF